MPCHITGAEAFPVEELPIVSVTPVVLLPSKVR